MKATLLLRGSQFSLVIGGLLLILIGSGIHTEWIRPLVFATIVGGIVGFIYEAQLRRRGEGDDIVALLLPAAGMVSGIFVFINA